MYDVKEHLCGPEVRQPDGSRENTYFLKYLYFLKSHAGVVRDVLHPKLGQKTTFTPILLVTPTFSILQRFLGHI